MYRKQFVMQMSCTFKDTVRFVFRSYESMSSLYAGLLLFITLTVKYLMSNVMYVI